MRENQSYKVSVIIPTFNRKDILKECLQALFTQNLDLSWYEIIVVDDGSTDGIQNILNIFKKYTNFRYIQQENAGPAVARNKGAKLSHGELLLFLDDDVIASSNLVNAHISAHEKIPKVAVLGYTPFDPRCVTNRNIAYHQKRWNEIFQRIATIQGPIPYHYFMTLNISLHKDLFMKVGGFNECFRNSDCLLQEKGLGAVVAFEDTELGYRLSKIGVQLIYCEEALGFHMFSTSFPKSCRRKFKSGYLAGTLYGRFPYLKEDFLVDYCKFEVYKNSNIKGKFKKILRKQICNEKILNTIRHLIEALTPIVPLKILHYLYAVVESNYYALGFHKGEITVQNNKNL